MRRASRRESKSSAFSVATALFWNEVRSDNSRSYVGPSAPTVEVGLRNSVTLAHGLTLGAITGRLIAERVTGEKPLVDLQPFRAERF